MFVREEEGNMRAAAIILLILCLAAAGLTGYLYLNTNVIVTGITCVATDAADQAELFSQLKTQAQTGTFTGMPFATSDIGEAGSYQFYTYTVHLTNQTFIRAEVAEVRITPMNGDVLQMAENEARSIPARKEGTVQATILTAKEMHSIRELTLTYYLWGLPFSERLTYSN